MKINERGYWENSTAEGHGHDEGLAKALVEFFIKNKSKDFVKTFIIDVGCGDGFYTNYINSATDMDILMCWGIDGNPNTIKLAGPNTYIMDLSKPIIAHRYDWVLSLEVGEHIPETYEKNFLENLDGLNKYGIVLSWAVRGQGGDGHVNCLDNAEVISKLDKMGYIFDVNSTQELRSKCAKYPDTGWWFRNTLMVFRKNVTETCSNGYYYAL